jgi:mono/diheme cytochrome c family protein
MYRSVRVECSCRSSPVAEEAIAVRAGKLKHRILLVLFAVWAACLAATFLFSKQSRNTTQPSSIDMRRREGLATWHKLYSVLTHPRCINCHTATNYPGQGDDRHRHLFNVVRGPSGTGVPGLNCATCHQQSTADATGVPGAATWRLAPLTLAWQDRNDKILSTVALCKVVADKRKNGGLGGDALLEHHEQDPLVKWAFAPGLRSDSVPRSLPPLTHEEFVAATRVWTRSGMPCPQNRSAIGDSLRKPSSSK